MPSCQSNNYCLGVCDLPWGNELLALRLAGAMVGACNKEMLGVLEQDNERFSRDDKPVEPSLLSVVLILCD